MVLFNNFLFGSIVSCFREIISSFWTHFDPFLVNFLVHFWSIFDPHLVDFDPFKIYFWSEIGNFLGYFGPFLVHFQSDFDPILVDFDPFLVRVCPLYGPI